MPLHNLSCAGVSGSVKVNGKPRPSNSIDFRKLSCYIHQDDVLRQWLTVNESMICAAHLKLGSGISMKEKNKLVSIRFDDLHIRVKQLNLILNKQIDCKNIVLAGLGETQKYIHITLIRGSKKEINDIIGND